MKNSISQAGREEFGRRLRALMLRSDMRNNGDLAARAAKLAGYRITRQMVHKWINGIVYASSQSRQALARVFGVPVEEITIYEVDGRPTLRVKLSESRVRFRILEDDNNPAIVRAEMSDYITRDQAEKIQAILGASKK